MDTQAAFGFKELLTHIVSEMARAVCERMGESRQHEFTRTQAAAHMIMGFMPRDAIEAMLAGHCVMFHEMMTDSVHDTLRGEMDSYRRATRSNIVALDKCFGNNLERLERYRARPAQGRRDEPDALPADALDEMEMTERAPRPEAPPAPRKQTPPAATETAAVYHPSPEAIAVCRANPAAMAALEAGDPEAFARAMGIDQPSEAYLAAQSGVFDRRASGARQSGVETHRPAGADPAVRMVRDGVGGSGPGQAGTGN